MEHYTMDKEEAMALYMDWMFEEEFNAWLDKVQMDLIEKEAAEYWTAWD